MEFKDYYAILGIERNAYKHFQSAWLRQ